MVRGNSITEAGTAGYEPYSEVMASLIAQVLGLPDYNAWEIVKRTNACLMEAPYWLRFSEDETFEDTTCGRARRIMNDQLMLKSQISPYILYCLRFGFFLKQCRRIYICALIGKPQTL